MRENFWNFDFYCKTGQIEICRHFKISESESESWRTRWRATYLGLALNTNHPVCPYLLKRTILLKRYIHSLQNCSFLSICTNYITRWKHHASVQYAIYTQNLPRTLSTAIPRWKYRFSSDHRSQATSGVVST